MSIKTYSKMLAGLMKTIKPKSVRHFYASIGYSSKNQLYSTDTKTAQNPPPKLVYYGILTPQVKAVKFFSLSSSMIGIMGQPLLYSAVVKTGSVPIIVAAYSFIGFFTFVTPVLLHFITKRYVTHLEFKEDTDSYVAKTVNFFCVTREMEFKTDDVKVPDIPGMFTTLMAKGKPLFFDPKLFGNPHHYAKLMGYDKPMDFKLYQTPPADKKE